jgi:branched-chain amino acid transport system substrate-binding protein
MNMQPIRCASRFCTDRTRQPRSILSHRAARQWFVAALCSGLFTARSVNANDASVVQPILLGSSTAITGPAQGLGQGMTAGIQAAIDEANREGGAQGRPIHLIVRDDGYEPARTGPNMHHLLEEDKVVAVIGNVGTPTAVVAVPICNENKVVLFGAFTGAGVLRKTPPDRYVINYRASYAEETATMVDALVKAGIRPQEIAFFTQRDAYGDAGFAGGVAALRQHGLQDAGSIVHGRYERNTTVVEGALAEILSAKTPVRAVILVGSYEPCAKFIQDAKAAGLNALFLNVSFVGSDALAQQLGASGEDVIITQVVPDYKSDLPLVRDYRSALAASHDQTPPSYTSLEGYVTAKILLRAMAGIRGPIDRASVVRALEALGDFDIGSGESLRLDAEHHQASHRVWVTVIRDGKVVPLNWDELHAPKS